MRRSKIIIGVFIGLILIVLTIVLLACTVFIVRDVKVEAVRLSGLIVEEDILESAGLTHGRSIISIDKNKIKASIEKANPYVEVISIERVFPSTVLLKVDVRTGTMTILSKDGLYAAVIDADAKVLKTVAATDADKLSVTRVTGDLSFLLEQNSPFDAVGTEVLFSDVQCGKMLKDIAKAAADPNLGEISGKSFSTFFTEIRFDRYSDENVRAYIVTNGGVTLVLDSALQKTVFAQLYICMEYLSRETSVLTHGFVVYDSTLGAYHWVESIG